MKILLVDDDPYVRRVSQLSLSHKSGWQILTAASGMEALSLAAQEHPEVILLDLSMPDMDGLETLAGLRKDEAMADVKVIILSASVSEKERQQLKELGAVGFINKPFDPMQLQSAINAILAKHGGG